MGEVARLVLIVMLLSFTAMESSCFAAAEAGQNQSDATKSNVTQHGDPRDVWDKGTSLVGTIVWPLTLGIVLFSFRSSIKKIIEKLGSSGGEISFGGLGIKLPVVERASVGDDVLLFKTADPTTITNDSAKTTLLKMLREPDTREYVVINLGSGNEWISSRLFIFALMLQRMKSIHSIVFLDGSVPRFLGIADPDSVRWSLAVDQPWLEQAYVNAYAAAIYYQPGNSFVVSKYGALDPQVADNVVRNFVQYVKSYQPAIAPMGAVVPPVSRTWAVLGNSTEYGTWLTGADLQTLVGGGLHREAIQVSNGRRAEARSLLQCTAPYVARVKNNGEFVSLVDRVAFVDEFTSRLASRLELLRTGKDETV